MCGALPPTLEGLFDIVVSGYLGILAPAWLLSYWLGPGPRAQVPGPGPKGKAQGPGPEHRDIVASWDAASVLCCFLMCKCLGVLDILASGAECSRCWVHFCTLFSAFFNVFGQGWKLCFVMTLLCTIVIFRVFEWAGPQHLLHCGGFWWILVDFGGFRWMLVDSSGF